MTEQEIKGKLKEVSEEIQMTVSIEQIMEIAKFRSRCFRT